jgi:hypothetical protein
MNFVNPIYLVSILDVSLMALHLKNECRLFAFRPVLLIISGSEVML